MPRGLHCKACDAPLYDDDDGEMCRTCLAVVFDYNRDLVEKDTDFDDVGWFDINLIVEEEQ